MKKLLLLAALCAVPAVHGQDAYPSKPVAVVVPF